MANIVIVLIHCIVFNKYMKFLHLYLTCINYVGDECSKNDKIVTRGLVYTLIMRTLFTHMMATFQHVHCMIWPRGFHITDNP